MVQTIHPDEEVLLTELFSSEDGRHAVTKLKHNPRDFSHQQLAIELARAKRLRNLFTLAQRVIKQTKLTPESVRFYASLVEYYGVYKLKRMTEYTDSVSGEVLGAGKSRRGARKAGGQKQDLVTWEELDALFKTIGEQTRCRLDNNKLPEAEKRQYCDQAGNVIQDEICCKVVHDGMLGVKNLVRAPIIWKP